MRADYTSHITCIQLDPVLVHHDGHVRGGAHELEQQRRPVHLAAPGSAQNRLPVARRRNGLLLILPAPFAGMCASIMRRDGCGGRAVHALVGPVQAMNSFAKFTLWWIHSVAALPCPAPCPASRGAGRLL